MAGFRLEPFAEAHMAELMGWFPDAASVDQWSGPFLRFPFTEATFREDLRLDQVDSWALLDEADRLTGFGQVYERFGRNHLARIAVNPDRRGQGVGHRLLAALMAKGAMHPGCEEFGLYVYPHNEAAMRCYRAAGFIEATDPESYREKRGLIYLYMVASAAN